ncbi:hypothetical protein QEN19_003055 [Hanseniaspora menglaensis]
MGSEFESWVSSEPFIIKNNKFQSHLTSLYSRKEIETKLKMLIESNKKIKKASHKHIFAYNIPNINEFGFDDDGEAGASENLLKILKQHKPKTGHLLAVTRWNTKGSKLRQQKISNNYEMWSSCVNLIL